MKIKLTLLLALAGFAGSFPSVSAQVFEFAQRDLLLEFSQSGKPDLEVNLGSIDTFKTLAPGASISLSGTGAHQYDPTTQLFTTYSDLGNLSVSLIAEKRLADSSSEAVNTSWLSKPSADEFTQSTAPKRFTASKSQSITSQIDGIGVGAATFASGAGPFTINSQSVVAIDSTSPNSYSVKYNSASGLKNLIPLPGIQNTTPADFTTTPGQTIRSDLYEYAPGSTTTDAAYLGYLLFHSDGSSTFTAVPEPGTYALWCGGALAGWAARRNFRRRHTHFVKSAAR